MKGLKSSLLAKAHKVSKNFHTFLNFSFTKNSVDLCMNFLIYGHMHGHLDRWTCIFITESSLSHPSGPLPLLPWFPLASRPGPPRPLAFRVPSGLPDSLRALRVTLIFQLSSGSPGPLGSLWPPSFPLATRVPSGLSGLSGLPGLKSCLSCLRLPSESP